MRNAGIVRKRPLKSISSLHAPRASPLLQAGARWCDTLRCEVGDEIRNGAPIESAMMAVGATLLRAGNVEIVAPLTGFSVDERQPRTLE